MPNNEGNAMGNSFFTDDDNNGIPAGNGQQGASGNNSGNNGTNQDDADKSKLGRKFKEFQEQTNEALGKILAQFDELKKGSGAQAVPLASQQNLPPVEDDTELMTRAEFKKMLQEQFKNRDETAKEHQKRLDEERTNYVKTYRKLLGERESEDEYFKDIVKLMEKHPEFDVKHSDNPAIDLEINYAKASRAFWMQRAKRAPEDMTNPFSKNRASGTGLADGGQSGPAKKRKLPRLDEMAREFIEATGRSEDDVLRAIGED
jgi:hypothetical protein